MISAAEARRKLWRAIYRPADLRILGVLLLLVLALRAPTQMAQRRWQGPRFDLRELRDPSRVAPWPPFAEAVSESALTVQGPGGTEHFTVALPRDERLKSLTPAPVPVGPDGTVTLPDGTFLRIQSLAVEIFPQRVPGVPEVLPAEQVYVRPDGGRLDRAAASQFSRELHPDNPHPTQVKNTAPPDGAAFQASYIFRSSRRVEPVGVFDALTGAPLPPPGGAESKGAPSWHPGYGSLFVCRTGVDGVRPSPMALHVRVPDSRKPKFTMMIGLGGGWWNGRVHRIWSVRARGRRTELIVDLPAEAEALEGLDREGKPIRATGRNGTVVTVHARKEQVAGLVVTMPAPRSLVVVPIPPFPQVPAQNRTSDDLMQMVLPPTVVQDEEHWNRLLSSLVQARWTPTPPALQARPPLTFPLDVGGLAVGDVLAIDHAGRPPCEVVLERTDGKATVGRFPLGTVADGLEPELAPWRNLPRNSVAQLLLVAVLFGAIKAARFGAAVPLRNRLNGRGYTLTLPDTEFLLAELGTQARHLPPREAVAVLPDVDVSDPRSLAALMRRAQPRPRLVVRFGRIFP